MSLVPRKSGRIRRYIASVLLSTTMLFSGLFSTGKVQASSFAPNKDHHKIEALTGDYPGRNDPDFNVKTYTLADQDSLHVPPSVMPLWQNMQRMKKDASWVIGPTLARFAAQENIWFAYEEHVTSQDADNPWSPETYLQTLPRTEADIVRNCLAALQKNDAVDEGAANENLASPVAGWWYDRDGVVYMTKGSGNTAGREFVTIAHELIHGVQNTTGSSKLDHRWSSIRDFQASALSYEAAASAYEFLIAWELAKDSTDMGPWHAATAEDSIKCALIVRTYNDALARGTPYALALEQAGGKAFCHQFSQQWWLDATNDQMLGNYISYTQQGLLNALVEGHHYGIGTMQQTGYLSPHFNLTAQIDSLPANLFGDWNEMRQAFDRADLYRYECVLGKQSALYQDKLAEMRKDNNPYLNVDMGLVYHTLQACGSGLLTIAIMDYYADLSAPPQNMSVPQKKLSPRN